MGQQVTNAQPHDRVDPQPSPTAHLGDQPATVNVDDGQTCDHAVIGVYGGQDGREGPIAEVTVYRDAATRAVRVDVDTLDRSGAVPILRVDGSQVPATPAGAGFNDDQFGYDVHGTVGSMTVSGHVDEEDGRTVVVRVEPDGEVTPPVRVWVGHDLVHNTSTPDCSATDNRGDRTTGSDRTPADDHWTDNPDHPVADWQYEVANEDTRLGYREWCENQHDMEG